MTTMHRNALPTNRPTDRPTLPRPLVWLLVLARWQVRVLPATARVAAPGPLVLPADARPVNVWSVATMLADRPFTAIGRAGRAGTSARFCSPSAAWVWAKTPSGCGGALMPRVVSGNGWIVNIDFAVLNDVGIHLTKQGQRIQHAALGSLRPYSERPLCGHAPAMTLDLGRTRPMSY